MAMPPPFAVNGKNTTFVSGLFQLYLISPAHYLTILDALPIPSGSVFSLCTASAV